MKERTPCLKAYHGPDTMLTFFTLIPNQSSEAGNNLKNNNKKNTTAGSYVLCDYYERGIGIVLRALYITTFNYYKRSMN